MLVSSPGFVHDTSVCSFDYYHITLSRHLVYRKAFGLNGLGELLDRDVPGARRSTSDEIEIGRRVVLVLHDKGRHGDVLDVGYELRGVEPKPYVDSDYIYVYELSILSTHRVGTTVKIYSRRCHHE